MKPTSVDLPDGTTRIVAGWDPYDVKALRRLVAKVRRDPVTGCWLWQGSTNPKGYGRLCYRGAPRQCHRVAYTLLAGPIPGGLQIDHTCRTRHCCNPTHLEPVTARENLLRGNTVTARHATKTHCDSGHRLTEDNVYRHPRGFRYCRTCKRTRDRAYRASRTQEQEAA